MSTAYLTLIVSSDFGNGIFIFNSNILKLASWWRDLNRQIFPNVYAVSLLRAIFLEVGIKQADQPILRRKLILEFYTFYSDAMHSFSVLELITFGQ